ncbi:MAG TPA: ATP-binding protein [Longimicrobium sp.]|nr:ATP-binding protein [Longimicrobium sp.]
MSSVVLFEMELRGDPDMVAARQRTRETAELLGFDRQDATRVATAVSEIARNALVYAGGGTLTAELEDESGQWLRIRVADGGSGGVPTTAVAGMGISGARRLMDDFRLESDGSGTRVSMAKRIPRGAAVDSRTAARAVAALAATRPHDPVAEVQQQNGEILRALAALEERQEDLLRLNRELEDTNRGVVALYAELDQRAEQHRKANETKAQFLSYMSHEFRTPLDSMLALSGILLARTDGPLSDEQETQVGFIRRASRDLMDMVDDLLAAARVDAGEVRVRPGVFTVEEVYNSVRAVLRPLLEDPRAVPVRWDAGGSVAPLHTDEAKVAQILRNLVSNALKFAERGEVRVSCRVAGDFAVFEVADEGLGIGDVDQVRIFEDFAQVDSHLQRQARGSGLGLPLSRKLAVLLGGDLAVRSMPSVGSVFTLTVPATYTEPATPGAGEDLA